MGTQGRMSEERVHKRCACWRTCLPARPTRLTPSPLPGLPDCVCLCRARTLAREQGDLALASLACLPDTPAKRSLELMVDLVLERLY